MFCCGRNGCFVIEINEDARRYAEEKRLKWAWEQKRKTGRFPPIEKQSDYMQAAYERYINLKGT